MNKKQILFLSVFITIFMIIALYGVLAESNNGGWNGMGYYLLVVPSLVVVSGLASRFMKKKTNLTSILKFSFLISTCCYYILMFLGNIHYNYPKAKSIFAGGIRYLLVTNFILLILHVIISLAGNKKVNKA